MPAVEVIEFPLSVGLGALRYGAPVIVIPPTAHGGSAACAAETAPAMAAPAAAATTAAAAAPLRRARVPAHHVILRNLDTLPPPARGRDTAQAHPVSSDMATVTTSARHFNCQIQTCPGWTSSVEAAGESAMSW